MPSSGGSRRVRVERGIYRQENGRYAVCVMVERRPRFRTIDAGSLREARILRALSCVFTFALRRGYIATHPFHRLERDERPHPLRSDQRVLTQNELARLFAACPARYRPLLLTGAYTGMRLSEVLGLAWDDVDFAAGVIHVRHQLARGRRGVPPHRIPPNTRASVRAIPLLPQLAAVLPPHKRGSPFPRGSD